MRILLWFDWLLQDVRDAGRTLRRSPATTAAIVATLALGIGATTLLFSIAYGVLRRPLQWPDAQQLVRVTETRQGRTGRISGTVTNATLLTWRDQPTTIEDIGGWITQNVTLTGPGEAVRVVNILTTPNLFHLLRVRPSIGRLFTEDEGARDQPGVTILSNGFWREHFGGRPDVLGQTVQLDGRAHTVVGVMPRDFVFPDAEPRLWTAWRVPPVVSPTGTRMGLIMQSIARLRDGATAAQAAAEATARARNGPDLGLAARALFGADGPIEVSAVPELEAVTADVRSSVLLLFGAVILLMAAVVANVAGLQLARATARRHELAVRAAIGASQQRLVRQLLTENVIVALSGAAGGLLLAAGLHQVLPSLVPERFPRLDAVVLDVRVFMFALATSMLVGLATALAPIWQMGRLNVLATLAEDPVAPIGTGLRSAATRMRALIMVGQIAIACLLLVSATLMTTSLRLLSRADRGYDSESVLTARLPLPDGYTLEQRRQLVDAVIDRLRAVPGVSHAAYGTALPFLAFGGFTAFTMRSPTRPDVEMNVQAAQRIVSPEYFTALRLRLREGRPLAATDTRTSPPVIVVNRTFAQQYLGERPVGSRIPQRGPSAGGIRFTDKTVDWEVVGVVDDMRQEMTAPAPPEVFASIYQITDESTNFGFDPILIVRTAGNPDAFATTLRSLVREQAPTVALDSVMTMEDRVRSSLSRPRLIALMLTSCALFSMLIVGVGLYGVVSFTVAQRTREIGVRAALGAQRRDIVALVLRQTLWIAAAGITLGVAATIPATRLLSAFLYGIGAHDPLVLAGVPAAILAVATVACLIPTRRAVNLGPLVAIRTR